MSAGRPLSIGVQLPEVEREVRWPELCTMARLAEDIGFDSVWVGDHLLYRNPGEPVKGPWEAWSLLAAIGASTDRIQIGPLVAATAFHSPAMLAKKAATVDEISGGRLILGLGAGWNEIEFAAFGFAYEKRVARFAEAFTIIRTLLREGAIDFHGEFYAARECEIVPRGPRPHGPPIMLGARGPRMLRTGLAHADAWNGWHAWYGNRTEHLPRLLSEVDSACADVGRVPADIDRSVTVLVALSGSEGRLAGSAGKRGVEPLRGTADELAEALAAYTEHGISHIQLVLDPITPAAIDEMAPVLDRLDRGGFRQR